MRERLLGLHVTYGPGRGWTPGRVGLTVGSATCTLGTAVGSFPLFLNSQDGKDHDIPASSVPRNPLLQHAQPWPFLITAVLKLGSSRGLADDKTTPG